MTSLSGWLPLALVTAAIGVLTVIPAPSLPTSGFELGDKVNHIAAMIVVAVLAARSVRWRGGSRRRMLWMAVGYPMILGVLIEIVQSRIPDRSSDPYDILADAIGTVVGLLLLLLLERTRQGRRVIGPASIRTTDTPLSAG